MGLLGQLMRSRFVNFVDWIWSAQWIELILVLAFLPIGARAFSKHGGQKSGFVIGWVMGFGLVLLLTMPMCLAFKDR